MSRLTQESLGNEAAIFSALESQHQEASLYGVTDGKAIGTYLEQKFKLYLKENMILLRVVQPVVSIFLSCWLIQK